MALTIFWNRRPSTKVLKKSEDSDDDDDIGSSASLNTDEEDNDNVDDSNAPDEDGEDEDLDEKSPKKMKTTAKRENRSTKAATPSQKKKPPKVVVQVGKTTLHKDIPAAPKKARGATSSLYSLAKKVLDDEEQESLVATLLYSKNEAARKQICLDVIQHHRDDSNACQVRLINFIFRVVGGSSLSALSDDTELEEMGSDDWSKVITDLVDDMRYCAAEHVLICADPNGAVVAKPTKTIASMGVREFRTVYRNFWFTLAEVALEDNAGRFEIEMLRDWLSRTHELTLVAQPDIRAAAVLASLQMSLGALQRTVILKSKEVTIGRQLKSSTGRKAEAFQYKLDTVQRSRHDLEEIVDSTFSTVFMNRYRDSNPFIRAENITALSKMTLLRPDIYLSDKYLKYIGWTLSDKVPCVRIESLSALTAPFLQKSIDLASMENVIRKFLPRLADCTIDVDIQVQEKAMALFLLLDRANFLEEFEDDALWAQINNRALASDTSAVVRRDALQFILDQLEAFDYGGEEEGRSATWAKDKNASLVQSLNKTAAKQLSTLAGW
jgi:cohesin complex subunit SA-1/2